MASLNALREEVDARLAEEGRRLADVAAGRRPRPDLLAVDAEFPTTGEPDTALAVRALAESARTPETQRPALQRLAAFLAHQSIRTAARAATDALERSEATAGTASGPDPGFQEALGLHARAWEARTRAARTLGFADLTTFAEAVEASPPAALLPDCIEVLRHTEDAYRELLGYVLKRVDPELRALPEGRATREDLDRAATLPWLPRAFPGGERLDAAIRWLGAAGLTVDGGGRIELDRENREGKRSARAFAVEVPQRVRLVLPGPSHGSARMTELLASVGVAQHLAGTDPALGLEERRLWDGAIVEASAALVAGFTRSEPWLRRFLGHGKSAAREIARAEAFVALVQLRALAARLPHALEMARKGPTGSRVRAAAQGSSEALRVRVTEIRLLAELLPDLGEAGALRSCARAQWIQAEADRRFDAEQFRNPAAAAWLRGLWAAGQRPDPARGTLADAAADLVQVLGA